MKGLMNWVNGGEGISRAGCEVGEAKAEDVAEVGRGCEVGEADKYNVRQVDNEREGSQG